MNGTVVTIGNFDGVHAGHRALVRRAREVAASRPGARTEVVVLSFDPHPQTILRGTTPARLSTWAQRCEWLMEAGADRVERLEPTPELLGREAEEFIENKVRRLGIVGMVEGPDFRFGHRRRGDIQLLRTLGERFGFSVDVVPEVETALTDHLLSPVRSTTIRWLLEHGRVRDAGIMLGRPYQIDGTVVRGDRRGRTIGFPTLNIATECAYPADGVYAGVAHLPDGRTWTAAISVGTKPTFGEHQRTIEAYLWPDRFEAPSAQNEQSWKPLPGLPEYNWPVRLDVLAWVREQVRFDSLPHLLDQLIRDCERVDRTVHSNDSAALPSSSLPLASLEASR